ETLDYLDISIILDDKSGVISIAEDHIPLLKDELGKANITAKIKSTGIPIPYHSKFLKELEIPYQNIVNDLFHKVDGELLEQYKTIFEKEVDLKTEIVRQLTGEIRWDIISNRILKAKLNKIYDTSPNNFIKKKIEKYNSSDVMIVGSEIW